MSFYEWIAQRYSEKRQVGVLHLINIRGISSIKKNKEFTKQYFYLKIAEMRNHPAYINHTCSYLHLPTLFFLHKCDIFWRKITHLIYADWFSYRWRLPISEAISRTEYKLTKIFYQTFKRITRHLMKKRSTAEIDIAINSYSLNKIKDPEKQFTYKQSKNLLL